MPPVRSPSDAVTRPKSTDADHFSKKTASKPASPRARRRKKRFDAILDAAERLSARLGLEGLTMAKLAAEVDITAGALYRYFESKEELIVLLQVRAIDDVTTLLARRLSDFQRERDSDCSGDHALAAVMVVNAVHSQWSMQKPAKFGLLAIGLADPRMLIDDESASSVWKRVMLLLSQVEVVLNAAVAQGTLTDGDNRRRALLFVMGSQGMLQLGKMSKRVPGLPSIKQMSAELCDALLLSWGAQPEALVQARNQLG